MSFIRLNNNWMAFDSNFDDFSSNQHQKTLDVNDYTQLFLSSKYYDVDSVNKSFKNLNNNLLVMHFNVRRLSKNVDKHNTFLCSLNSTAIAIEVSETELKENAVFANIASPNYKFINRDSLTWAGALRLYRKETLIFKVRNDLRLSLDQGYDLDKVEDFIENERKRLMD